MKSRLIQRRQQSKPLKINSPTIRCVANCSLSPSLSQKLAVSRTEGFPAYKHTALPTPQKQSGLKILSAPCATGEEACSIALSLLESGCSQTQFHIIATDISRHAIKQARSGIFSENAFRSIDETRKNKWFTATATGWQVAPEIQETVEFLDRNLLQSHTENELIQKAQGPFDLICCRNLLVYFTKPKRDKLIRTLARLLKPDGELVVGAAEAVILPAGDWEPTGPLTFRMRKKASELPPVRQKINSGKQKQKTHSRSRRNQPIETSRSYTSPRQGRCNSCCLFRDYPRRRSPRKCWCHRRCNPTLSKITPK